MKIKTASEGVIDHKHDVESFFFFKKKEIFSQGISLQVIFSPREVLSTMTCAGSPFSASGK